MRNRSREIDRDLGRYAEMLSRWLWPWREIWLLVVVGSLFVLDYTSTYVLLELSGKKDVYESGRISSWALENGGFFFLFMVDVVTIGVLSLVALAVRYAYSKHGYLGYGRAAYIFLLTPYTIITAYAIVNTTILILR